MNGDPTKLKTLCPYWDECLDSLLSEYDYDDEEKAEIDLAYQNCCGCVVCVLLRHKVGCGNDCFERKNYPQYQDDDELFNIAVSWDPEEIYEELYEEHGMEPDIVEVVKEGVRRQQEATKKLLHALEDKI